jgi:tetratricopeptide (TPR) repeat protein
MLAAELDRVGCWAMDQGDYAKAGALMEESLRLRRLLQDRQSAATALEHLATLATRQGDYEKATELFEESLRVTREVGDRLGIAGSLLNYGDVLMMQRSFERAEAVYLEGLRLTWRSAFKDGMAWGVLSVATAAALRHDHLRAARLLSAAEAAGILHDVDAFGQAIVDEAVQEMRRGLGRAAYDSAWEEGRTMGLEPAARYALGEST